MNKKSNQDTRVCPVEIAGILDHSLRRLIQNPRKILKPFIETGMTVLDLGCAPGFFTIENIENCIINIPSHHKGKFIFLQ